MGDTNSKNALSRDIYCECDTYVYIWKTVPHAVGHVAMQVGGCRPKISQNDTGEYISIHPGIFPSVGPTTIFPLPASLSSTLVQDMEIEATYHNPVLDQNEPIIKMERDKISTLAPDYTIKFNHLKTQAMLDFIEFVKHEVQACETTYQLFPKVDGLGFLRDMPHYLTYNSIDAEHAHNARNSYREFKYGSHVYNCATLVSRILNEGGINVKDSNTPWGQSPNNLWSQLLKLTLES